VFPDVSCDEDGGGHAEGRTKAEGDAWQRGTFEAPGEQDDADHGCDSPGHVESTTRTDQCERKRAEEDQRDGRAEGNACDRLVDEEVGGGRRGAQCGDREPEPRRPAAQRRPDQREQEEGGGKEAQCAGSGRTEGGEHRGGERRRSLERGAARHDVGRSDEPWRETGNGSSGSRPSRAIGRAGQQDRAGSVGEHRCAHAPRSTLGSALSDKAFNTGAKEATVCVGRG
jgi:hypothetical protein